MIYKYQQAAQQIANEGEKSWEVERLSADPFPAMYLKGAPFPLKGIPTAEGLFAMNIPKRILMECIKFRPTIKGFLRWFTEVSFKACSNAILKEDKRMPLTIELCRVANIFSKELGYDDVRFGEVVSHIFEYDSAYRARLQDMANEAKSDILRRSPIKEISRLLDLMCEREIQHAQLPKKYKTAFRAFKVLLLHPRIRRTFNKAIRELDLDKLRFDEGDRYWTYQRTDYQIAGIPVQQRHKILEGKGYHITPGKDIKK